jgi:leader peptidase (prepilin peptidase)/N-methyltransferase
MMSLDQIAAVFPWFLPLAAFVFGACIGSFLNVCIYRIPAEQSIVTPGSHCACGKPVAWHDNIPILSWLILRGRARCCGRPFSIRYPAIELLTALLFVACWVAFPGEPGKAVCGWVLVSMLIAGSFIDLDHLIIPDVFTIGLGLVGVLLSFAVPSLHGQHSGLFLVDSMRSGMEAVLGLIVGSGFVLWFVLVMEAVLKKEAPFAPSPAGRERSPRSPAARSSACSGSPSPCCGRSPRAKKPPPASRQRPPRASPPSWASGSMSRSAP